MRRRQAIKIVKDHARARAGVWGHRTTRAAMRAYLLFLKKKWGRNGSGWFHKVTA